MDLRLQGQSVLVTGGTRGIGRAIALAYARERARVAITFASDADAAANTVSEIEQCGGHGLSVHLDLCDRATIDAAVATVVDTHGGLDVAVANAVRWPVDARGALVDSDPSAWSTALEANLEGTVSTVRAALPHLAGSADGRLVLISSGIARQGMAGGTAYSTGKGALEGLLASLKWEAGAAGVLVNIVSPGFTVTENNLVRFGDDVRESVRERTPSGHLSVPDDIASAVLLLGSPANGNITGAYLPVAGGID